MRPVVPPGQRLSSVFDNGGNCWINIASWQKAALSTSHWLLRCQIVLTKRMFNVLPEIDDFRNYSFFFFIVWLEFKFLSSVTI